MEVKPTCLLAYLLACLLTFLIIYLLIYLITYLFTYLLTHSLTHILTPWSRTLLEKLTGFQLVKKFPSFYGTRKFFTALTSACHLSLSWAISIQSTLSYPTSWRSILILSSNLGLGHPSVLYSSGFLTKILYTPLLSPIHATCPAYLILLDLISRVILSEKNRTIGSKSTCKFSNIKKEIFYISQQRVWASECIVSIETTQAHHERIVTKNFSARSHWSLKEVVL